MNSTSRQDQSSIPRSSNNTLFWMLTLAAALPLLPTGMFAGIVLALMIGYVLLVRGHVRQNVVLWILTGLVLIENLAFAIGYLT